MIKNPPPKNLQEPPQILLISGSDSSGAAGMQADMATCFGLGAHPQAAMTAVTAQYADAVISVNPVSPQVLQDQLIASTHVGSPAAVKIGLIASAAQAGIIKQQLHKQREWENSMPVVWDPVMTSTSGASLTDDIQWMKSLLSVVDVVTPNVDEAERLTDCFIQQADDLKLVADLILQMGPQGVWIKGGHRQFDDHPDKQIDLFCWQGQCHWLVQDHLEISNSRGTGCTLATALAVFIAQLRLQNVGKPQDQILRDAVVLASAYVHQGLKQGYSLGIQAGPVARLSWPLEFNDYPAVVDNLSWLRLAPFPDCGNHPLGLYPVVDELIWLERLVKLGVPTLQLRVKDKSEAELDEIISAAVALCQGSSSRLFINDYWQLAIKHGAYGVHLGQEDMASADLHAIQAAGIRLGISTHGEFEWCRAASIQPSYLAIGAIYPTDTKDVVVVGEDNLYRWASILKQHFPLTAIGGINLENLPTILGSGVASAAVVSAITKADDYEQATLSLLAAME